MFLFSTRTTDLMKKLRLFFSAITFSMVVSIVGCSSEPPAEATGDSVPADYADQQAAAQKAAQEAAKQNAKKR